MEDEKKEKGKKSVPCPAWRSLLRRRRGACRPSRCRRLPPPSRHLLSFRPFPCQHVNSLCPSPSVAFLNLLVPFGNRTKTARRGFSFLLRLRARHSRYDRPREVGDKIRTEHDTRVVIVEVGSASTQTDAVADGIKRDTTRKLWCGVFLVVSRLAVNRRQNICPFALDHSHHQSHARASTYTCTVLDYRSPCACEA